MSNIEEIKNFLPSKKKEVELQGQTCEIRPFNLEDCVKLVKDFVVIFEKINTLAKKKGVDIGDLELSQVCDFGFIANSFDNFKSLICHSSNITDGAFAQLELKSVSKLIVTIIELNNIQEIIRNFQQAGQLLEVKKIEK